MPEEYTALVEAMKQLTQGEGTEQIRLPMAENEWNTRPDDVSYGVIAMDFEADAMHGDNLKVATAYEGSVDLYSMVKGGAGWIPLITQTLTDHCGGAWSLNSFQYERETGLFHWEWAFQVED
jgi:hypothetical protein